MSSSSDSSDAGFCTNENKREIADSSKKRRKKINISFQELRSDKSDDSKKHVHELTPLVRDTYLSYLIKILSCNYKSISTNKVTSGRGLSVRDIKECAMQMEQNALLSSVVTGLYQKAMLQMVAEIKHNTERQELHGKLCDHSQLFDDQGTQTESFLRKLPLTINNDAHWNDKPTDLFPSFVTNNENTSDVSDHIIRSPNLPSEISHWPPQNMKRAINNLTMVNKQVLSDLTMSKANKSPLDINLNKCTEDCEEESLFHSYSESDECADYDEIESALELVPSIKIKSQEVTNGQVPKVTKMQIKSGPKQSLDERLAALHFDKSTTFDVGEFSPEKVNDELSHRDVAIQEDKKTSEKSQESPGLTTLDKRLAEIHGESGQQATTIAKAAVLKGMEKPKKKLVWRYEERYYTRKLQFKLNSLSTAKRVKVESRLNELFVSGGQETKTLRKRLVVEDPLLEYKDRIKPWVVKHLMPHYKSGKIESRDFFKHVARHITDSLVEVNHLPDEADVIDSIDLLLNA